ncbi:SigE family RNA polymerase sigma factor [Oryzobacter telluris]|uniref:SigE family RNA polymerase sigma factor n=1 Tax=Oryzobacter telluris TaxID=3149179 RepID=UPI00370D5018
MRAREREEYVRFVRARHASLFRSALLLTGNHHTAEDVVQATWVKVYASWPRVRRADRPVAYVHRMLANEVISARRRRSAHEVPTDRPGELAGAGTQAGPEDAVVDARFVFAALATLTERQRAVVVLRYYADLTEAEIADALGVAPGTVKGHARAALAALAAALQPYPSPQDHVEESR